jgi:anaerobic ribonucleoside-triphosphate reductase
VDAHKEGIIHFHDMDYFIQRIYNCCLINMEDVLQNGTVISQTMIETPKSFLTACNIATQVIAQVASSQFGGQSFSLAHLAPFVQISRKKLHDQIKGNFDEIGLQYTDEEINQVVEMRLNKEIEAGIQMIQYQILTLMTTNGQTPFVSMFIWINEVDDGQTRKDLARLTEEVLNQRIQGIKNEKGVYVTPAFPKILYVLDENNITEDSEYWYLTELAAKCSAKRLVPDFISAKKMREYKKGDVYPCMGCFDATAKVYYRDPEYMWENGTYQSGEQICFEDLWKKLADRNEVKTMQRVPESEARKDGFGHPMISTTAEYIDLENKLIWDSKELRFVKLKRIIKNSKTSGWVQIHAKHVRKLPDGKTYYDGEEGIWLVTFDHPMEVNDSGKITPAEFLQVGDYFYGTRRVSDEGNTGAEFKDTSTYKETFHSKWEIDELEKPYHLLMESYDVTTETEHFWCSGMYSHNCRSFLTPDRFTEEKGNIANAGNYVEGKHKYYGRFNQGVVTINLVDVACSSKGDMDTFWKILDERLELCHEALRCRHERLLGTSTNIAPILFQHGAIARLGKDDTIDPLLFDGYSTISLGYAGLYETCKYMLGLSHTTEEGKEFGLAVMQRLNDKTTEWKEAENIDYSVYGTPLESTTYKFAKCLKKRFGEIEGVTDHNYITNSYHCVVREEISAFDKLKFESEFQKLSPGGAISYVEVPNMTDNIEGVLEIIKYIYENIMYAEINSKSDYCMECGYDGEIKIKELESGKLIWECPNCGNTDQNKMSVARRSCGYIGTQFWNQGRTQEIKDRVLHVSIHNMNKEGDE